MKSLINFGLDGTLAESKSDLDGEMATLTILTQLIGMAINSGGAPGQFGAICACLETRDNHRQFAS